MSKILFLLTILSHLLIIECHRNQRQRDQDDFDQRFRRRYNKMPTAAAIGERFRFFDGTGLKID